MEPLWWDQMDWRILVIYKILWDKPNIYIKECIGIIQQKL